MNTKNNFDYVSQGLNIAAPTTWQEAFWQYEKLTHIAEKWLLTLNLSHFSKKGKRCFV